MKWELILQVFLKEILSRQTGSILSKIVSHFCGNFIQFPSVRVSFFTNQTYERSAVGIKENTHVCDA